MRIRLVASLGLLSLACAQAQITDTNSNGISDIWELQTSYANGGVALNPLDDEDGDGQSNALEAAMLTNPLDPVDHSYVTSSWGSNGHFSVDWTGIGGVRYVISHSPDLQNWTPVLGPFTGAGTVFNVEVPEAILPVSVQHFFRIDATSIDSDSDGVADLEEAVLGFDSSDAESSRSLANGGDSQQVADMLQGLAPDGGNPLSPGVGTPSELNAARFLSQATMGVSYDEIQRLQAMGDNAYEKWIDEQLTKATTLQEPYIDALQAHYDANNVGSNNLGYPYLASASVVSGRNSHTAWMRNVNYGDDLLRQRVAWVLSQIFVISRTSNAANYTEGQANYYDMLADGAFGNFEDLLVDVSLHPMMGRYLSHLGNVKADPSINRLPDENYAREVMQLFSIGLYMLNQDGTFQLDGSGERIESYTNFHITELAKVFTGLWLGGRAWGSNDSSYYERPMVVHQSQHDRGQKVLVNGGLIADYSGTYGRPEIQDIYDSLNNLFIHPNCAPFVCTRLIQHLVTSNPSPEYVERVADVFDDNGSGVRGDLGAVVKAILLDPDARGPRYLFDDDFGRLKEPMLRTINMTRALKAGTDAADPTDLLWGVQWWDTYDLVDNFQQTPLESPTVFNFYQPEYAAPGEISAKGLVSPEFQILNTYTAVSSLNEFERMTRQPMHANLRAGSPPMMLLYNELNALGSDEEVVDRLTLLFGEGYFTAATRSHILRAVRDGGTLSKHLGVFLSVTSPEGAVSR